MIPKYVLKMWFEEQVRFRLHDGTEEDSAFIGTAEFFPLEILKEFKDTYKQEFGYWLYEEWKPRQSEVRREILSHSNNRNRYRDLKDAVIRQQVAPLVGVGHVCAKWITDMGRVSQES